MNSKTKILGGLFVALVAILFSNPMMVYDIYNTILGRIVLVGILIFLSMKNVTLGLLVALAIITALNQYGSFAEGMDTMNSTSQPFDKKEEEDGIDKEDIKNAIASKSSNSIPAAKTDSSEVSPAPPTLLKDTKENFASYASAF